MDEAAESLIAAVQSGRADIVRAILDACDKLDGDGGDERRLRLLNSTRVSVSINSKNGADHCPASIEVVHPSNAADIPGAVNGGGYQGNAADIPGAVNGGGYQGNAAVAVVDGCSALHVAVLAGHVDVVRVLLSAGADARLRDARGKGALQVPATPAVRAAFVSQLFSDVARQHVDGVRALVDAGVDVNCVDSLLTGNTPLHWAASFSDLSTVDCLLELGSVLSVFNMDGCTPLHDAVLRGHVQLVEKLVRAGANSWISASDGKYAGRCARDLTSDGAVLAALDSVVMTTEGAPAEQVNNYQPSPSTKVSHRVSLTSRHSDSSQNELASHLSDVTRSDLTSHLSNVTLNDLASDNTVSEVGDLSRDLWPLPRSVTSLTGPCFLLGSCLNVTQSRFSPRSSRYVEIWESFRAAFTSLGLKVELGGVDIAEAQSANSGGVCYTVSHTLFAARESYSITVRQKQISVKASDAAGLRWAISTMLQLIRRSHPHDRCSNTDCDSSDDRRARHLLPVCVTDSASVSHRAFLLDINPNGRVPNMEHVFALVSLMAALKMNYIHLFCRFDDSDWQIPYSPADIARLLQHCEARGVSVVPALDVPALTSLSVVSDNIRAIDRFLACFPGHRYVHCGPNLTTALFDISCDSALSLSVRRHLVLTHETTLMLCANVLRSQFSCLPTDVILVEYGFQAGYEFDRWLEMASGHGVSVMAASGTAAWNSLAGSCDSMLVNVRSSATACVRSRGCGVVVADWRQIGGVTMVTAQLPGVIAASGFCWNHNTHLRSALRSLPRLLDLYVFGSDSCHLGEMIVELSLLESECMRQYRRSGDDPGGDVLSDMPPDEGTILLRLLVNSDSVNLEHFSTAFLSKLLRRLSACHQRLTRAPADVVTADCLSVSASIELSATIGLVSVACRICKALVAHGSHPLGDNGLGCRLINVGLSNLSPIVCTDLANRLLTCVERFRRGWLQNSLQSRGMSLSLAVFTSLLHRLIPESCHNGDSVTALAPVS